MAHIGTTDAIIPALVEAAWLSSGFTAQLSSSPLHHPFTLEAALVTFLPTLQRRSEPALPCHKQLAHF